MKKDRYKCIFHSEIVKWQTKGIKQNQKKKKHQRQELMENRIGEISDSLPNY